MMKSNWAGITCTMLLVAGTAQGAATDAQKCQASKNKAAGEYAACRQNAEKGLALTADAVKYAAATSKCADKLTAAWQKAIDKATAASATCPDSPLVVANFQSVIDEHTDNIATALGGGGLQDCPTDLALALACGNGVIDAGEQCDQGNLNGESCATQMPGTPYGTLACGAGCAAFDISGCVGRFEPRISGMDAMVVDHLTGLVWVKTRNLDGTPNAMDLLDADNQYTWCDPGPPYYSPTCTDPNNVPDGSAFTAYIAGLNAMNGGVGYGGHNDWRLPTSNGSNPTAVNAEELGSIIDPGPPCGTGPPCIDETLFGPTSPDVHWSASTHFSGTTHAYIVPFGVGGTQIYPKGNALNVRAVRAGL